MASELAQLWTNAIAVSSSSGVPAPALVAAYLELIAEHELGKVPPEAIDSIGAWVVEQFGVLAVLPDHELEALASVHNISVETLRNLLVATSARQGAI